MNKNVYAGYIVEEKSSGIRGITRHSDGRLNGRLIVHALQGGQRYVCSPEDLKVIGFVD